MKYNRLKYSLLFVLLLVPVLTFSQRWKLQRAEITAGLGGVNYFGDIGGTADESNLLGLKDISIKFTRPNINFGGRYRINERFNVKANLVFGYLEGSDANSRNASRNYAFSSSIFELSGQVEYSLIPEKQPTRYSIMALRDGLRTFNQTLNTYVFAGLGGIYFNAKALEDLSTSDRFDDSKNFTLVVPVGVGVKYPLNSKIYVGFELGGRWAASDYLDGLTTKYSNHFDIYYFSLLNVVFKIDTTNPRRFRF